MLLPLKLLAGISVGLCEDKAHHTVVKHQSIEALLSVLGNTPGLALNERELSIILCEYILAPFTCPSLQVALQCSSL